MSIAEEARAVQHADELARARRTADEWKQQAVDARKLNDTLTRELGLLEKIGHRNAPPGWLTRQPKATKKHHGTPFLLLSDLHLDEVVRPSELGFVNAYDRQIAVGRLQRTFEGAVRIASDYWSGVIYDGIVAPLAGDIFSGIIHDELKETNEDTILGSLDFWIDQLVAGYRMLGDYFPKVHVPVVPGNHGRMTRKPRAKFRSRDSFDWFVGRALMRIFADDKRFTFDCGDNADALVQSYGQTICITHGDQATGGSGIGGIWPPIMRLDAKKRQRYAAVGQPYDVLALGHWHQLVFGKGFIVNGSLKGYDEYAAVSNFGFEQPAQAFWLQTPEHGMTLTSPIFPCDRKAEDW